MRTILMLAVVTVVVFAGLYALTLYVPSTPQAKQFSSYAELSDYIKTRSEGAYYGATSAQTMGMRAEALVAPTAAGKAADYSTTNIQVANVDEPDIVKTDGKYIYTINQDKVTIVDAYPAETASIVSTVNVSDWISEIFINNDKLVVFGGGWGGSMLYGAAVKTTESIAGYPYYTSNSFIYVYDVSDHANPVLVRNITLDGNYYDARMIGDYVYAIATQPVQVLDSGPVLPTLRIGSEEKTVNAEEIMYFDTYDTSFSYNYVISLNTQNDDEEPNEKVFLLGYAQSMFVSTENIYVVYTKYLSYTEYNRRIIEAVIPQLPFPLRTQVEQVWNSQNSSYDKMSEIGRLIQNYAQSLGPEQGAAFMKDIEDRAREVMVELEKESEKTVINKIAISGPSIEYKMSGEVPGRVLNQFSMDEHNGNFRIATTTGQSWENTSLNHIYVLDSSLDIRGSAENLARGEQIYSVRFMGDRAYMVTFHRTDPLFVIDMSNPLSPVVLGELKMPGFSDYLHPYDEGHLIGVGQQTDESGRATGQVKLSLFDVSDVSNPSELSTYLIGDSGDWSYSEALHDHKAFLFSESKNLLVIPVSVNNWEANKYEQGAYVFDLTLENGFSLRGTVSHEITNASSEYQYYDYSAAIRRALYMDSTLYTISDKTIKANSLVDLSEIATVRLE